MEVKEGKKTDVDEILSLGEELQRNIERYSSRILLYRMAQISMIFITLFIVIFFYLFGYGYYITAPAVISLGASFITLFYVFFFQYAFIRKFQKRLEQDNRALYEVIEFLRELGDVVAEQEGWSEIDKMRYRIQLARFNIGKSKDWFYTRSDHYNNTPENKYSDKSTDPLVVK